MLTKIEKKAFTILLLVCGVLLIFFLCFGVLFPDAGTVPYTDAVPDKTRVTYSGEILSSRITAAGGHVILDVSGVVVFVEGGAENIFYKPGDTVQVVGIAETYDGAREIVVGASGSLSVVK